MDVLSPRNGSLSSNVFRIAVLIVIDSLSMCLMESFSSLTRKDNNAG